MAEQALEPGDAVLFFSDGVSEARNHAKDQLGIEGLGVEWQKAQLDGLPPAEAMRRLGRRVMEHSGGRLRDDSTLVLFEFHHRQ